MDARRTTGFQSQHRTFCAAISLSRRRLEMKATQVAVANVILGGALALFGTQVVVAQDHTTTTRDQTTTTTTESHSSDAGDWHAPRGYADAYPESGAPNMVARQGYSAGFNQGQADAARGKKFNPTENDAYGKAVIPKGMDHGAFKQEFREAFVKGYSNGFKGESH
jgi:hypothetical protein